MYNSSAVFCVSSALANKVMIDLLNCLINGIDWFSSGNRHWQAQKTVRADGKTNNEQRVPRRRATRRRNANERQTNISNGRKRLPWDAATDCPNSNQFYESESQSESESESRFECESESKYESDCEYEYEIETQTDTDTDTDTETETEKEKENENESRSESESDSLNWNGDRIRWERDSETESGFAQLQFILAITVVGFVWV